jgi:large subunit ribosomal protein L35
MPKLKTKSGLKRRIRVTSTGKVVRTQAGKRHGMRKRSRTMRRNARGTTVASGPEHQTLSHYNPYPKYLT